jgi:periplasmic divalent cation tolerance protein
MLTNKPEEPTYVILLTTTSSSEEAHRIAETLLKQKKAACVNIIPGVSSLFSWQDNLNSTQENLLIIKTLTSLLNQIILLIRDIHSYEVPEIIALPIIGGHQDYLNWIDKELK